MTGNRNTLFADMTNNNIYRPRESVPSTNQATRNKNILVVGPSVVLDHRVRGITRVRVTMVRPPTVTGNERDELALVFLLLRLRVLLRGIEGNGQVCRAFELLCSRF